MGRARHRAFRSARGVLSEPSGKLVAAGYRRKPASDLDIVLLWLDSNGTLDPSFGAGGVVVTDLAAGSGSTEYACGIVRQPDGKLVVAGTQSADPLVPDAQFLLLRYKGDGGCQ